MRKFRCINGWARDSVGDIIDLYIYQRYPREIRENNFVEIFEPVKKSSSPKVEEKVVPQPVPEKIKPVAEAKKPAE